MSAQVLHMGHGQYISTILASLPFWVAYLINIRPKRELGQLPEIVDERESLQKGFILFLIVAILVGPIVGMSVSPRVRVYASIALVLSLPLSLNYHIGVSKLRSLSSNLTTRRGSTLMAAGRASRTLTTARRESTSNKADDRDARDSAAFAVKMADMYEKIGRVEETVQLCDETLNFWRKGGSNKVPNKVPGRVSTNLGQKDNGKEEVAAGFTRVSTNYIECINELIINLIKPFSCIPHFPKNDLKSLEPNELELVIQLLRTKGKAIGKLNNDQQPNARLNM